jgi:hypothetical protein
MDYTLAMRTRSLILSWCAAELVFLAAGQAQANPIKSPKRLIEAQPVDLTPLFKWWANHSGTRPMTAWVHITGTVVATNSFGWVVDATVDAARNTRPGQTNSPPAAQPMRLLLKNPPVRDFAEFERLRTQLTAVESEREALAAQAGETEAQQRDIAQRQTTLDQQGKMYRQMTGERQVLARQENQVGDQMKSLDQQRQEIRERLADYPNQDRYVLDCMALSTGQAVSGFLLFDHGAVSP